MRGTAFSGKLCVIYRNARRTERDAEANRGDHRRRPRRSDRRMGIDEGRRRGRVRRDRAGGDPRVRRHLAHGEAQRQPDGHRWPPVLLEGRPHHAVVARHPAAAGCAQLRRQEARPPSRPGTGRAGPGDLRRGDAQAAPRVPHLLEPAFLRLPDQPEPEHAQGHGPQADAGGRVLVPEVDGAQAARGQSGELLHQPFRAQAVLDVLRGLHREAVGAAPLADLGRLGRAARQGPEHHRGAEERVPQTAAEEAGFLQGGDQPDRGVLVPQVRARSAVGDRGAQLRARRRARDHRRECGSGAPGGRPHRIRGVRGLRGQPHRAEGRSVHLLHAGEGPGQRPGRG